MGHDDVPARKRQARSLKDCMGSRVLVVALLQCTCAAAFAARQGEERAGDAATGLSTEQKTTGFTAVWRGESQGKYGMSAFFDLTVNDPRSDRRFYFAVVLATDDWRPSGSDNLTLVSIGAEGTTEWQMPGVPPLMSCLDTSREAENAARRAFSDIFVVKPPPSDAGVGLVYVWPRGRRAVAALATSLPKSNPNLLFDAYVVRADESIPIEALEEWQKAMGSGLRMTSISAENCGEGVLRSLASPRQPSQTSSFSTAALGTADSKAAAPGCRTRVGLTEAFGPIFFQMDGQRRYQLAPPVAELDPSFPPVVYDELGGQWRFPCDQTSTHQYPLESVAIPALVPAPIERVRVLVRLVSGGEVAGLAWADYGLELLVPVRASPRPPNALMIETDACRAVPSAVLRWPPIEKLREACKLVVDVHPMMLDGSKARNISGKQTMRIDTKGPVLAPAEIRDGGATFEIPRRLTSRRWNWEHHDDDCFEDGLVELVLPKPKVGEPRSEAERRQSDPAESIVPTLDGTNRYNFNPKVKERVVRYRLRVAIDPPSSIQPTKLECKIETCAGRPDGREPRSLGFQQSIEMTGEVPSSLACRVDSKDRRFEPMEFVPAAKGEGTADWTLKLPLKLAGRRAVWYLNESAHSPQLGTRRMLLREVAAFGICGQLSAERDSWVSASVRRVEGGGQHGFMIADDPIPLPIDDAKGCAERVLAPWPSGPAQSALPLDLFYSAIANDVSKLGESRRPRGGDRIVVVDTDRHAEEVSPAYVDEALRNLRDAQSSGAASVALVGLKVETPIPDEKSVCRRAAERGLRCIRVPADQFPADPERKERAKQVVEMVVRELPR